MAWLQISSTLVMYELQLLVDWIWLLVYIDAVKSNSICLRQINIIR